MLKKILMASVAVGALALNAPAALADAPTVRCGFDSNQQDQVTGQNYEGVAYGFIAHGEGGSVSIRCYITVNGAEASSTPAGTGTAVATTAGRVTFQAADTDVVEICAEYSSDHGSGTNCVGSDHFQIPPQEVIDLLDRVFQIIADATAGTDPLVCSVIVNLAPVVNATTAVTTVHEDADDCDIWVGADRFIDFVPYGD